MLQQLQLAAFQAVSSNNAIADTTFLLADEILLDVETFAVS